MTTSHEDLCYTSAVELIQLIKSREISPVEVIDAVTKRIDEVNPKVNAFITRTDAIARATAEKVAHILKTEGPGALPPLAGIPVSIKDLTDTAGVRTTYGSAEFIDNMSDEDAHVAARIRTAGGALIGKASTPAFGWLGVTDNDIIGTTNNPWALNHTVGGSSGGSGAIVAAGMGPLATGSDGGGSIRIPAAMCGIVGLKPSHGRIPRGAESPLFHTGDALGPMARTVADAALLFGIMAGPVEDEPYMLPEEGVDYVADLRAHALGKLRIAYCPNWGVGEVDPEVAKAVDSAARHFESVLGCVVDMVNVDVADPMEFFNTYYPVMLKNEADAMPALIAHAKRYRRMQGFTDQQAHVLSHDWYTAVTESREQSFRAIANVFSQYDLLLTPTSPVAAWPHPEDFGGPHAINGKPVKFPTIDFYRFTEPTGHSGHPSMTINCGFSQTGLPIGLQIIGPQRDDRRVLRSGAAYEATTHWKDRRPNL
ncbi:amidase [Burkholderia cenocepacia]|uniref:amidase n=1 Tax=Burkholderia cenocepacia TaxID=95486 RepID=UPI002ABD5C6D|nr:amidase [Burkholderia cenocepacia]